MILMHKERNLDINSPQTTFEENIRNFAARPRNRGYPAATGKHLLEIKFSERETWLTNKDTDARKKILPSVTQTIRLCLA